MCFMENYFTGCGKEDGPAFFPSIKKQFTAIENENIEKKFFNQLTPMFETFR